MTDFYTHIKQRPNESERAALIPLQSKKSNDDESGNTEESESFSIFQTESSTGEIVGGCNGTLTLNSVYTDQLWVSESYRKKGLGRQLMGSVHALARNKGCSYATVCTMSFQAQAFYEKLGYNVEFVRDGYVHNSSMIWLKKTLFMQDEPKFHDVLQPTVPSRVEDINFLSSKLNETTRNIGIFEECYSFLATVRNRGDSEGIVAGTTGAIIFNAVHIGDICCKKMLFENGDKEIEMVPLLINDINKYAKGKGCTMTCISVTGDKELLQCCQSLGFQIEFERKENGTVYLKKDL